MADAAKKQMLCSLWGITTSIVDEKVATLKSIIGEIPTFTALDYLTKCDLNLDHCINLHFTQSITAGSDSEPQNTANSNHNNSNNTNHPSNETVSSTNNIHAPLKKRRRKSKHYDSDYDPREDCDSDANIIQHSTSKKRKHRSESHNSSKPPAKKRRLSSNTNSSLKQERDEDDDDYKEEKRAITQYKHRAIPSVKSTCNHAWNKLNFGSFAFQFTFKKAQRCHSMYMMQVAHKKRSMTANMLADDEWFVGSKKTKDKILNIALKEINDHEHRPDLIVVRDSTKYIDVNNKSVYVQLQYYEKDETYTKQLKVSISKQYVSVKASFEDVSLGTVIGLCTRNKEIYEEQMNVYGLCKRYKNKISSRLTLEGILDVACEYKYKVAEIRKQRRVEAKYGLAVKLYDYQLQSIQFLIDEENDPIGFYRHLYKLGHFKDNKSFFYYSAVFKHLMVNENLPVIHGGFLCEEMGLGKTIEAMALINYNTAKRDECSTRKKLIIAQKVKQKAYKWAEDNYSSCITEEFEIIYYKSRSTLIIAPVSLVGQWEKECTEKSTKSISFKRYYSSYRKRDVAAYIDEDIVFTTYGIIAQENGSDRKRHILHCIEWHRIILDESHYIKNANTMTSKHIHNLRARNKWLLTGTPFGRQVFDIHNQLKFLGVKQEHLDKCLQLKQVKSVMNSKRSNNLIPNCAIPIFKVMQCLVMRHKKAQKFNNKTIVEMTDKKEDIMFIEFSAQQKQYYDKLYSTAKERYEAYKATGNIGRGNIAILASLHPARQACSGHIYSIEEIEEELRRAQAKTYHIQQIVNDNGDKSAQELYDMAIASAYNIDDGECPICYETPFDDPLQTVCRHIFCGECIRSVLMIKAECPMCRKQCSLKQLKKPPSATVTATVAIDDDKKENKAVEDTKVDDKIRFDTKLRRLIDEINQLKREKPKDKSLIFTSFSASLDWICNELKLNGIEFRTLTGSMTMNKRKKALQEFEANKKVTVFVLTVRSGAIGITLTAANHVFLMEPPFNPALYRQAINRVHRLGQKKKVFIKTLIMKNSIEEKIWNLNKSKQQNNDSNNNNKKSNIGDGNLAGNISQDKRAKLQTHEISKLFE